MIKSVIKGDNPMINIELKRLKDKRKLTNQQLSDLSGVPIGTINRIMAGQTDNPSFQTVCDMVMAMDGSLDELVGIKLEPTAAEKKPVTKEIIALYESMIESKDMWIRRLFVVCCILAAFILCVMAYDLANPMIGYFQK